MILELLQAQQGLLIFVMAIACAHLFPMHYNYHPFTLLELVFKGIAERVYQPSNNKAHQYLSGTLACCLPILVFLLLSVGISVLAFHPQWLGGVALYLCLDTQTTNRTKRIATLLKQGQKATARQLLATIVARDVANLSSMGVAKACIDSTALRTIRHYYVMVVFYLLGGPMLALIYKLLLLCNHAWRAHLAPNMHFMKPLNTIITVIECFPIRGFVFLISLSLNYKKVRHYLKHYARFFYQQNSGWILCFFAANLHTQLGGPCMYQAKRFNKMRIGSDRPPEPDDLIQLLTLLNRVRLFSALVLTLVWIVYQTLVNYS